MSSVKFVDHALKVNTTLTVILDSSLKISKDVQEAAQTSGIDLSKVMSVHGYAAKAGEILSIPTGDKKIENILLFGIGEQFELPARKALLLGYKLHKKLHKLSCKTARVYFSSQLWEQPGKEIIFNVLLGYIMGEYKFDKYKTLPNEENNKVSTQLEVVAENPHQLNLELEHYSNLADSIALTKDLISEPPNVKTPISMASACSDLTKYGLEVQILDEGEIRALGMNALLGVAQGSTNAPRVVVMKWQGTDQQTKPLALVGKGVTFDTGGLSLKSSTSMESMKKDMAGSAVIIGAMRTLALRKVKANVVGLLGLVENMPDGRAQRPSDIVRSMSGQTIEVLNTDAEGRLLLADVLWYAQSVFNPAGIIDLATLTGAMRIALGNKMAGLFSNDDNLANKLYKTGIETGERLWRLPLDKDYDTLIDSKIADVKNIASPNSGAGSIVAAQFLQRFVNNIPWAHIDIAAVTDEEDINQGNKGQPQGPTAFGVRLLVKLIEDYYTVR
jgi:leucyl aminopeptidase